MTRLCHVVVDVSKTDVDGVKGIRSAIARTSIKNSSTNTHTQTSLDSGQCHVQLEVQSACTRNRLAGGNVQFA